MYKLLRVSYIIVVAYLFCGIFFFLSVPSSLCYLNLSNAKMETHFQLFSHQWKCIINKYSSKRFKKGGGGVGVMIWRARVGVMIWRASNLYRPAKLIALQF
jgi:hypothetical protein